MKSLNILIFLSIILLIEFGGQVLSQTTRDILLYDIQGTSFNVITNQTLSAIYGIGMIDSSVPMDCYNIDGFLWKCSLNNTCKNTIGCQYGVYYDFCMIAPSPNLTCVDMGIKINVMFYNFDNFSSIESYNNNNISNANNDILVLSNSSFYQLTFNASIDIGSNFFLLSRFLMNQIGTSLKLDIVYTGSNDSTHIQVAVSEWVLYNVSNKYVMKFISQTFKTTDLDSSMMVIIEPSFLDNQYFYIYSNLIVDSTFPSIKRICKTCDDKEIILGDYRKTFLFQECGVYWPGYYNNSITSILLGDTDITNYCHENQTGNNQYPESFINNDNCNLWLCDIPYNILFYGVYKIRFIRGQNYLISDFYVRARNVDDVINDVIIQNDFISDMSMFQSSELIIFGTESYNFYALISNIFLTNTSYTYILSYYSQGFMLCKLVYESTINDMKSLPQFSISKIYNNLFEINVNIGDVSSEYCIMEQQTNSVFERTVFNAWSSNLVVKCGFNTMLDLYGFDYPSIIQELIIYRNNNNISGILTSTSTNYNAHTTYESLTTNNFFINGSDFYMQNSYFNTSIGYYVHRSKEFIFRYISYNNNPIYFDNIVDIYVSCTIGNNTIELSEPVCINELQGNQNSFFCVFDSNVDLGNQNFLGAFCESQIYGLTISDYFQPNEYLIASVNSSLLSYDYTSNEIGAVNPVFSNTLNLNAMIVSANDYLVSGVKNLFSIYITGILSDPVQNQPYIIQCDDINIDINCTLIKRISNDSNIFLSRCRSTIPKYDNMVLGNCQVVLLGNITASLNEPLIIKTSLISVYSQKTVYNDIFGYSDISINGLFEDADYLTIPSFLYSINQVCGSAYMLDTKTVRCFSDPLNNQYDFYNTTNNPDELLIKYDNFGNDYFYVGVVTDHIVFDTNYNGLIYTNQLRLDMFWYGFEFDYYSITKDNVQFNNLDLTLNDHSIGFNFSCTYNMYLKNYQLCQCVNGCYQNSISNQFSTIVVNDPVYNNVNITVSYNQTETVITDFYPTNSTYKDINGLLEITFYGYWIDPSVTQISIGNMKCYTFNTLSSGNLTEDYFLMTGVKCLIDITQVPPGDYNVTINGKPIYRIFKIIKLPVTTTTSRPTTTSIPTVTPYPFEYDNYSPVFTIILLPFLIFILLVLYYIIMTCIRYTPNRNDEILMTAKRQ